MLFRLAGLLFLIMTSSLADRDPFDMFAEPPPSSGWNSEPVATTPLQTDTPASSSVTPKPSVFSNPVTAVEHFKEVHRVLARILWNPLHMATIDGFNDPIESDQIIRLEIRAQLTGADLNLLRSYCGLNQSNERTISADAINTVFSRLIESVAISQDNKDGEVSWLSNSYSWITLPSWSLVASKLGQPVTLIGLGSLGSVLILISHIGTRRLLRLAIPCAILVAIIGQSLIRKYQQRVAEKMAVLSRYRDPPEECKPAHLQSWYSWVARRFQARPNHDECAHYYQSIVTEPWISTNLVETFSELILEPVLATCLVTGKGLGLFYDNLLIYVPLWAALPVFLVFAAISLLVVLLCLRFPGLVHNCPPTAVRRRPRGKQVKSHSVPSITS